METVKKNSGKAQVKKSATLLNIYFFSRILLGLKQFVLLFIETGFINTILSKINFISSKFLLSAICSLIFLQSKGGKRQTLWLENRKTFVSCFAIIFSIKTPWESARHHRCFKKRSVGLQNMMFQKCYFHKTRIRRMRTRTRRMRWTRRIQRIRRTRRI